MYLPTVLLFLADSNVLKEIIVQPNIKIKVRLKIINGGKEDGHGIFGSVHYSEQLVFNALKGTRSTDEVS